MLNIGMSSIAFELNEKSFCELSKAKISSIEISLSYDKTFDQDLKHVKALADKYKIGLWSYHLPFGTPDVLDIASQNEDMRKRSVNCWSELIRAGADIGIKKFIAHPSSEPKADSGDERKFEIERSMRSLAELASVAAEFNATVAVENLPRSCLGRCSDEILQLISADSRLGVCFDTNHLLIESNEQFIDRVKDRIVTVHVSDYDFVNERHWLPGEGKINWQVLYNKLIQAGYNGVWMYEIHSKCPKTIIRDRDLMPSDFFKNADEIFTNKKLTVISRQKEHLGMWE